MEKDVEPAFPTIVASGKGASEPHYNGNKKLERGFCVIDFGVTHNGMCSDMTRTVFLGEPTDEEKRLYNYLLNEHHKLLRKVKKGSKIRYVEKSFRKRLKKKNKMFIHALSHGIGKEVHEKINKKLKEGDVLTVEPGLYEKNSFGIRIEDVVLVGKKREVLTDGVGKELRIFRN